MMSTDTVTPEANVDEAEMEADEEAGVTERARPDYTPVVLSAAPESDPPRRRGPSEGSAKVPGPKGITKLLLPICTDTGLWSVEGQDDVWVQIAEYSTATGAKSAIKNLAEHPEKIPVHDGAVYGEDVGWEFKDTRHYVEDGVGGEKRVSRLTARYWVSAEEYLKVTGRGGGEPAVSDAGADADAEADVDGEADGDAAEADGYDDQGFPV